MTSKRGSAEKRGKGDEKRIPFESSDFYLIVARRALEDLRALPSDGVRLGGWTFGEEPLVEKLPSDHFRLAVTCTVFSAAAVEHALVAIALLRKTSAHPPERGLVDAIWPSVSTGKGLLRIARAVTDLGEPLLSRMDGLLTRRNKIVHSQAFDWEEWLENRPAWCERGFELPPITPTVIHDAPRDLAIAEEAVAALRRARGDPRWSPFERKTAPRVRGR